MEALNQLAAMSNRYGSDPAYVLMGGGNTSYKENGTLWVKGSGTKLATIQADEFVAMDYTTLTGLRQKTYPADEAEREAAVLADMMAARTPGETRRPSVEALLHALLPYRFVLHVHPALVNGLTCGRDGAVLTLALFPDAVWVPECKPGFTLACTCGDLIDAYQKKNGAMPKLIFLQNHGVFFAADTVEEIDSAVKAVMDTLTAQVKKQPSEEEAGDPVAAAQIAPALRMLTAAQTGDTAFVRFVSGADVLAFDPDTKSATPDHIVYTGAKRLVLDGMPETDEALKDAYAAFVKENGRMPKVIYVKGVGAFACGRTLKDAEAVEAVLRDEIRVTVYAESFGGFAPMSEEMIAFILGWEVENYRSAQSAGQSKAGRLSGKVALITGAAQGFGFGIAEAMAAEGAHVIIADMNAEGAKAAADQFDGAMSVAANVTDEDSVENMIRQTVLFYGGLDVFINNAGVVRAGSLEEMTRKNFEMVTSVDYTAYFLCTKAAVVPMKIQHRFAPDRFFDIIEINSKSGLTGSNKNFAYAGAKFGGIGLTQSFALELAPYQIKCNAICPGNFLDGPLWSDPVKGLFVQYLNAGKVPGAKDVADVRRYYESKVPLNRGCRTLDVARAVFYIIEQEYETGQAVPVTGGQEMLN